MRVVKRTMIACLAFFVFFMGQGGIISYAAEELTGPEVTVLKNDLIKITVDNATGRFGIRTISGQPIRKNDQHVNMLFQGDNPETSFTTFRINGNDYIFGNPYKFAVDFFSEITKPRIVENTNGTKQIETIWSIEGVDIKQVLMLYMDVNDRKNAGNVNVRYEVKNKSGAEVQIGSRILLDTMVAGKDGPEFQIGTTYRSPLTVERKLVHDPEAIGIPAEDVAYYKLPPYWVMRDNLDLTNPLATNVMAYGFNNIAENGINIVDEMIVGHWNGLANTKWDYEVNPNLDFTRDTNDYGTADSAVALYWWPNSVGANQSISFETVYGLGEVIDPNKVFSIRYLDPVQQLAALPDNSGYEDEGIFDIHAEIENLPAFKMEHSQIQLDMTLEGGLSFVKLDEMGEIVRDGDGNALTEPFRSKELIFKKPATPEQAEQGIIPKYEPGDTITASFKVMGDGRAWPSTRQYLLTARSPQTVEKLAALPDSIDEGVRAEFESSKAGFILLPAIGDAAATYAYEVSPNELYSSDVKYVTVNLTNIEAYNTGDENTEPNFDLYFRETVTGKRYKVPVEESVLLQPTDSGLTGDMRITYRNGALVNDAGEVLASDLGPKLPLGEYQVEIDYKGDAGGDPELAALFDITTSQSFVVTDNNIARIREAGLLAVYKQTFDFDLVPLNADKEDLKEINEIFYHKPFQPGTALAGAKQNLVEARTLLAIESRLIDPNLEVDSLFDAEALKELPMYNYKTFESEEDLEAFFEDRDDRAQLVTIEGMIREVGTGKDATAVIDTTTEPAIINGAVAYSGKDLVFVRGQLEVFGQSFDETPLLDTLFVKGDGVLSVAGSGFVFHRGEWTIDFFNSFDKDLEAEVERPGGDDGSEEDEEGNDNPEDDSLNGGLAWAMGELGSRLNPVRQIMIPQVYFNAQTIFSIPGLVVGGFGFQFNETTLRPGGVSFGGFISFKVVAGEIKNVVFNDKGFVGVDAALMFELEEDLGLFKGKAGDTSGELSVVHYEQAVEGVSNSYGLQFETELANIGVIGVELAFKQVDDGRILPDVVGFKKGFPQPGILITGATYLTEIRGALRELADTIAGGTSEEPFPLTLEAGASLRFGVAPAYHFGDIDMTLKRTGIKIEGALAFSTEQDPSDDDLIPLLTEALLEAQWVTPWFVRLGAEVDVMGWNIIVGNASIFVGQNLEKNRVDFEGFIGAKVIVPEDVPIVGGIPLNSVFLGVNNEKVWGKIGVLLISLGITYYWGGGIEFSTSDEQLPEGLIHMVIEDPEDGPKLFVIGHGIETVATSWHNPEAETQGIVYREVAEGVKVIEQGSMNVGMGGIVVSNGGRLHKIPMNQVPGNALIEVTYDSEELPELTLKKASGEVYPIVMDNTNSNPEANAFTQFIPAASSSDGTDSRKAYIIVPQDELEGGGEWSLVSTAAVETKLLSVPVNPTLSDVALTNNMQNSNQFTASWKVNHAQPNDTVSLYLAEDPVAVHSTMSIDGEDVLKAGDAGLLLAKDLPVDIGGGTANDVTSGSFPIDVTQIQLLGEHEDIRGLLRQGNYYLRAELKSAIGYETQTSKEKFELIDPLAPGDVQNVEIDPAGNGMFALSFKPADIKPGHEQFQHSYVVEALVQSEGEYVSYRNFSELMFTHEELERYWNPVSGEYEDIPIGGWTKVALPDGDNDVSASPEERYIGLETGRQYVIGVSAVTQPTEAADKNENFHFANRVDSSSTLLPIPSYPQLRAAGDASFGAKIEMLTNKTAQSLSIVSDQANIEVEAFYNGESLGVTQLQNEGGYSKGEITFDAFVTDGTYGIELMARNTNTKDRKITMLYLKVDTLAPILYLDKPVTGDRTQNGKIRVQGQTTNDANLTVNGTKIAIDRTGNGEFSADIPVASSEPKILLNIVARDDAGNENRALVEITNDAYQAPVGLVLRPVKLTTDESHKLEASLKLPDGRDSEGEAQYKLVPIPDSDYEQLLTFNVYTGDAVSVKADGVLTAEEVGASLVHVEYRVSEEVKLQADLPVVVALPEPDGLADLNAYTTAVPNKQDQTHVSVTNAGDLIGHQLVYRVIAANEAGEKPQFKEDLSEWTLLPANGVVNVAAGSKLIVAKRTALTKEAVAATGIIVPNRYVPGSGSGGGGGIMIPPTTGGNQSQELYLNGTPIKSEWEGNVLVAKVDEKDITALEDDGERQFVISSTDASTKNILISFSKNAIEKLAASGKQVVIDLPNAKLTLHPEKLQALDGELEIRIQPNHDAAQQSAEQVARSLGASLLGKGEGVTVSVNVPISVENGGIHAVKVAIPDNIRVQDITAVVLQGPDGAWTPVPWQLEMQDNRAYASLMLTGEGSVVFLQNKKAFVDVNADFWGKSAIDEAASKLLMLGKGGNAFDPHSGVTRAEFPTLLLRASGLMNQEAVGRFTDVSEGDWFKQSVNIAAKLGIVTGTENGRYEPGKSINRMEGMTMAGRLLQAVGAGSELTHSEIENILAAFEDGASIPDWARKPVALAIHHGIIQGSNLRIDPEGRLSRAQAAIIVVRIAQLLSDLV
ncbi:S-layer homology domain-containing protein [Paenibacillus chungangensis]|uniref:S-layer homology domain-containing protein n=1 Tax=Paenibacillus chungangensis TaxID=696535 RepID=A0ABW3HP54_9BACL